MTLGIDQNGEAFIKLKDSGIPPLCALIDGLPMTFFGKAKTALAWFENEARYCPENKLYPKAIEKYCDMIARHERGEIPCENKEPRQRRTRRPATPLY
jgi:hypothetical protein